MSKITKTKEEWAQQLDPVTFYVAREAGTERPYTGKYYQHNEIGVYHCICCGEALFLSDTKFDSGCGWPSFFKVLEDKVEERVDTSHGMVRTEVICSTCDAHLGHVFPDGPAPTGLRYCINSVCLDFDGENSQV